MKRQRIKYFIIVVLLLFTEVLIANYVNDTVIRPYVGDILVVILIYCMVMIFVSKENKWIPFGIFFFAVFIEWLQYISVVEILGLEDNKFLRVVIGSVFDWKDIICYGIGCILIVVYEWSVRRRNKV